MVFLRERDGPDAEAPDPIPDPPESAWKTVMWDARPRRPVVPNGSQTFRWPESGVGRWNLDLDEIDPALTLLDEPPSPNRRRCSRSRCPTSMSPAPRPSAYFLKHLIGSDVGNLPAQEWPPGLRPKEVTWHETAPTGKLDLPATRWSAPRPGRPWAGR